MQVVTYVERPDLVPRIAEIGEVWPEFLHHANVPGLHWAKLRDDLPGFQLILWADGADRVVGRAQTIPTSARSGLPGGIDDMLVRRFERGETDADVLSAAVAIVDPGRRGEGLSALLVEGMRRLAGAHGLAALIAPVRPTWKERFPLIPLEEYARWTRADGMPYDPWIRLHVRLGGEILEVCPESMVVEAERAEWEEWTGLEFPADGDYVVPGALEPVRFRGGVGRYVEPNLWIRHTASQSSSS
jgi:GNAT superfamily N-acetyltransferase